MNTIADDYQTNEISKKKKSSIWKNLCANKYAYLLVLPAVISVIAFSYVPMGGIIMAFKDYDIVKGILGSPWVGFENFVKLFTYPNMLSAIWNTFYYGIVLVFGSFPFPIILALLFNELKEGTFKKITQTISYMPYFLSWITVTGLVFYFVSLEGPYNQVMSMFIGKEYEAQNLLMDSKNFLPILFISGVWKNVGWSSVIFLAAIAGIDPTLYEAASIDGCNRLKQIFHITLPSIAGTIIIVLIMNLGGLFKVNFEQVYGLQNVYTRDATEVISTVIYRQGIQNGQYSLATAFGLAEGLVSVTLLLIANTITKKCLDMSIW